MREESIVTLGLGWLISNEQMKEMKNKAGYAWSEFEEYFIPINPHIDETEYFFGLNMAPIEPGMAFDLIQIAKKMNTEINHDDFGNLFSSILRECGQDIRPETRWVEAQFYLINRFV